MTDDEGLMPVRSRHVSSMVVGFLSLAAVVLGVLSARSDPTGARSGRIVLLFAVAVLGIIVFGLLARSSLGVLAFVSAVASLASLAIAVSVAGLVGFLSVLASFDRQTPDPLASQSTNVGLTAAVVLLVLGGALLVADGWHSRSTS